MVDMGHYTRIAPFAPFDEPKEHRQAVRYPDSPPDLIINHYYT